MRMISVVKNFAKIAGLVGSALGVAALLLLGSTSSLADTSAESGPVNPKEPTVKVQLECIVRDPGDLKVQLGLNKGQKISLVYLSDNSADLYVDEDLYMTALVSQLKTQQRGNFQYVGRLDDFSDRSRINVQMQGEFLVNRLANLTIALASNAQQFAGSAQLEQCNKVASAAPAPTTP